jgi:hypothetical protein
VKIAGLFFILLAILSGTAFAAENESVYDRVMRTGQFGAGMLFGLHLLSKNPIPVKCQVIVMM